MRAANTRTRTLCLPSVRWAPFCSVPPIGSSTVVVPCAISSRNSTEVRSSSHRLPAIARGERAAEAASEQHNDQRAALNHHRRRECLPANPLRQSRGSTDPSSRPPPRCGAAANTRLARRENGRLCSQTVPGPRHAGEEQAFAAEQRGLDLADVLDLEVDAGRVGHHAAGVDHQGLAGCQLALDHGAAGMHEGQAVALELLHDEAFAAEEADAEFLLECDAQRHAARRAQERILLADQRAAQLAQLHRHDLAGVRRGERDALLAAGLVGVDGREQRFAGQQALAGTQQLAEQAALIAAGAVAEHGVHRDARRP